MALQTIINLLTSDQFRQRIVANIPNGWGGSDAMVTGNWGNLLRAIGGEMAQVQTSLQYAQQAMRLTTETSPELDLASQDFFGSILPRPAGMSDTAFASLIISNLFRNAATRPAIAAALTQLTGVMPRMLEPWSIFDTGVWDRTTYWDIDTPANPGRWGDGSQLFQGFIETVAPQIPLIGPNNPILGFDTTAYWDVPGYFFADLVSNTGQDVYSVVNNLRAEGTTIWVKLVAAPPAGTQVLPGPPTGLILSVVSAGSLMVVWTAPPVGTRPLTYLVKYRVTGTGSFQAGPQSQNTSAIISGLVAGTQYDVEVTASNGAGTGPASAIASLSTTLVPPSPATNLQATLVQATAVTLTWGPPLSGTPPFTYVVQYNTTGVAPWSQFSVGAGATAVTVINLQPSTTYFFEVVTSN